MIKNTKKQRWEIVKLFKQCEAAFSRAEAIGHQQAEAWASGALREANEALLDFDAQDFRYVAGAIEAARGRLNMALSILDRLAA